ncbi:unnamed protein product [Ranitomeya imitator]|uniref:Uncharacterized protein n=1 Tax=Ranitomeya imitator TaxID=111125 RepID=A0ABN9LKR1_9NEOB|nr:unnamed protein product [Ranitomeya imitator]
MGRGNQYHHYTLNGKPLGKSDREKDLGILVNENLPGAASARQQLPRQTGSWAGGDRILSRMSLRNVAINSDYSWDAGERAPPPAESVVPESTSLARGTSAIGAIFIVVNAALGAGLLNFPAAFSAVWPKESQRGSCCNWSCCSSSSVVW